MPVSIPEDKSMMLRHFLAALAYRTQKAIAGAPPMYPSFEAGNQVRTPHEIVAHMSGVLTYALSMFTGQNSWFDPLPTFQEDVNRFYSVVRSIADHLEGGSPMLEGSPERLLQGPFSDSMTHAGQLAMLRRLSGHPIPPENFFDAAIDSSNVGPDQPRPVSPDEIWPEAPE